MTDDSILSRETYLLYQNAFGFEPDHGNLTHWKGIVKDRSEQAVTINVKIPDEYPLVPPEVYLPSGTTHAFADQNGQIKTRSMNRWKPNLHVYQIIREVRQGIAASNFSNATTVTVNSQNDALNRQIAMLKHQLEEKKKELVILQNQPVTNTENLDPNQVAEESLINIEADIYALEESFDRLELDDVEFAKKYIKLRKRYFMIEKSIS